MYPRPVPETAHASRRLYMTLVGAILIIWLAPLFAVILTSFRSMADVMSGNLWGWPTEIAVVENYTAVFTQTPMAGYFLNSLVITIPSVIGVLSLSTLAGFVLARYRFPGNMLIFALFVGGNFLPHQIMMIPVRDLMVRLNLYDTTTALIIFHVAFQTGFATLFMRNFIAALPDELFQAARAEGATPFQTLIHVVVPLVRPALAALAILLFTFIWNDYFWAVVLTVSDNVKPVTAGLANLRGEWVSAWNLISAGTIIVAVPPVVMFFLMQKHFIAGLTMGAVKG
ncbi:carbohydrate ABC transporter permease (plasmid) [Sinorhizobium meliloti WSM1022]|jgi:multiple sugar transport system permease protein|uniref:carbohydrate ABC transporter permease n=1 Tax=Rhizobium meliloti TaxID=382 RepID=UPI0001E4A4DF|nr:carbohydrate ABC transporter permease [Sinorhizobium meliloti]AEG06589.1 ABC-type transporter, integral membrane subunit [Sinorhizobium meliloti BL225C]AGA08820.1 ABC-type sugar transport system, permease component [Sinorhizobium meliloti GR4]ASJ62272.1 sugar ABC transporter permease [Sinorhizobium meliloti]ASP54295.1 carbohydrate ABC transporter permease [Sinorhizobium meliloti]ASQ13085.1 carbohydrate ABC transporter permease [Sinorhizobium meliloti]